MLNELKVANQLRYRGEFEAAVDKYRELINKYGESADLCAAVANCYYRLAFRGPSETGENYVEAIRWLKKALALQPTSAHLHADLGEVYHLGFIEYDQAANEYRLALEINPHDAPTLYGAASLYGSFESVVTLDEAIAWMKHAVELEPDEPSYHMRLGNLYVHAGHHTKAKQEWTKALLCSRPIDPEHAKWLGFEND